MEEGENSCRRKRFLIGVGVDLLVEGRKVGSFWRVRVFRMK